MGIAGSLMGGFMTVDIVGLFATLAFPSAHSCNKSPLPPPPLDMGNSMRTTVELLTKKYDSLVK